MIHSSISCVPARAGAGDPSLHASSAAQAARARIPYALRPVLAAGFLSLLLWAAVYVMLFSHTLWGAPTLVPDRWPGLFYPIEHMLPLNWVQAYPRTALGWANDVLWVLLVAALAAAWLWALRAAARLPAGDRWLQCEGGRIAVAGLVCFSAILVFSPGVTSQDLYSTIFYAKIAGVFGGNPYTQAPSVFAAQDAAHWLQWLFWKDQPCVYGPAWLLPASLLAKLAEAIDGDIVTYLLSQRLLAAVVNIANALLIWHLAGRFFPRWPSARLVATLFYAWCPLVVWEFANNGHNDALLIFWALVAIWCHQQARAAQGARVHAWWLAAVAALTLAGLTKVTGFLLIPPYLMILYRALRDDPQPWRQRARVTLAAGAVVLGLGTLLYLPYWDGPATLLAILRAPGNIQYANSLGLVLRFWVPEAVEALGQALGQAGSAWAAGPLGATIDQWLRPLFLGTAAVIGVVLTLRVRGLAGWLRNGGWLLLAYVLIGATWLWPWYLTWIMPLAALAGPGRLRKIMTWAAIGGMVFYVQ